MASTVSARPRLALRLALAGLALLPACGSTSYLTVVQIDPPDATLYINGERLGTGDKLPRRLSFDQYDRVYIQAVKRGFAAETKTYTAQDIADINDTTGTLKITLQERR